MRVRVSDDFYYPDVTVSCTPVPGPFYFIADPVLIAEVLSESTERIDRHEKRLAYQRLTSLKEYVLVTQDKVSIEVYRRLERGWELERFSENDTLRLEAVGFTIPVTDLYQDVMNVP
jgi:Uma2 family endonuclease